MTMNLYSGLDEGLQSSGVVNPLLELENTWNKRKSNELRTVGSVFAEVDFLRHFTFRTNLGVDYGNNASFLFTGPI
jgi:hypothetical protein